VRYTDTHEYTQHITLTGETHTHTHTHTRVHTHTDTHVRVADIASMCLTAKLSGYIVWQIRVQYAF